MESKALKFDLAVESTPVAAIHFQLTTSPAMPLMRASFPGDGDPAIPIAPGAFACDHA